MNRTPNLPTALIVAACPAPHLVETQYDITNSCRWLQKCKSTHEVSFLKIEDVFELATEFSATLSSDDGSPLDISAVEGRDELVFDTANISIEQRNAICNDLSIMNKYIFRY